MRTIGGAGGTLGRAANSSARGEGGARSGQHSAANAKSDSGFGPDAGAEPTLPATVTVTDSIGREVELPGGELERIISLAPSATEILFAIGVGNRVIGVDDFSNYPAETADIPKLGSFSPDLERIVALEPDLVVGSTITSNEVIEQLESWGSRY